MRSIELIGREVIPRFRDSTGAADQRLELRMNA